MFYYKNEVGSIGVLIISICCLSCGCNVAELCENQGSCLHERERGFIVEQNEFRAIVNEAPDPGIVVTDVCYSIHAEGLDANQDSHHIPSIPRSGLDTFILYEHLRSITKDMFLTLTIGEFVRQGDVDEIKSNGSRLISAIAGDYWIQIYRRGENRYYLEHV